MAGIGAAINTGGVSRGKSVAVFGCGGVGDGAIAGSALAGARRSSPSTSTTASSSGPRSSARRTRATRRRRIRSSTSSRSRAGSAPTCASRRSATRRSTARRSTPAILAGTVVLVGVPRPDDVIELPFIEVFGAAAPQVELARRSACRHGTSDAIDLYRQGRLDLDRFVSEEIALDDVEEAFHKMERGEVLRSVVVI